MQVLIFDLLSNIMLNGDDMRRILSVFIILSCLFSLVGCGNTETSSQKLYSKPVIVLPDQDTAYTINGYKNTTSVISSSSSSVAESHTTDNYSGKYFGNRNSKKFHKSDCRYAKNMNEENLMLFETRIDAIAAGYAACSVCAP